MTIRFMFITILAGVFIASASAKGAPATPEVLIRSISEQLPNVHNPKDKARLYCFRARNHAKLGNQRSAIDDYLKALNTSYEGWILNELGHFMFGSGEFEKAYNVAEKVLADFPQFNKEANKLKRQAQEKWEEEQLRQNPPTITIDSDPDPNRVSRHDLIRKSQTGQHTSGNKQNHKSTAKSSPGSATSSSRPGGSHISGYGTNSAFRQNYIKSRRENGQ